MLATWRRGRQGHPAGTASTTGTPCPTRTSFRENSSPASPVDPSEYRAKLTAQVFLSSRQRLLHDPAEAVHDS